MRLLFVSLAGIATISGCASLLTPSGSAATRWANLEKSRAAKAAGAESNQICKTLNVTGSNFPQKVCSTQDEWDQFNAEQRQAVDELDRARRAGNTGATFEGN